ncbi:hypothetical protein Tco_1274211 [Tanacetum coccineum]
MTITNQELSIAEIEQIIAQRIASVIETIAIYETKTCVARESMNQTKQQEYKMAENASNKRNAATTSGLVIKLEIVGLSPLQPHEDPQWQNRRPKLPVMSVER